MAKKTKYEVHVRAVRTRVLNPQSGKTETVKRGHVFKNPWPELIEIARADKKNRVFALIEINKAEEKENGNE